MMVQEPLKFIFKGYSVWLELESFENDLDAVLQTASTELGVHKIPSPHVTVIYGVSHLPEWQVRKNFRDIVLEQIPEWPPLKHKGFITDVEYEGVNGGLMDMAWMEVTHETSEEHEELVSLIHSAFHGDDNPRDKPWMPHSSIAYDNPGPAPISPEYLLSLIERFPTLRNDRKVKAIALWKTAGTIDSWKLIDRIMFEDDASTVLPDSEMEEVVSSIGAADTASIDTGRRDEGLADFL